VPAGVRVEQSARKAVRHEPLRFSRGAGDEFNTGNAMHDAARIASFGSRPGGSDAERQAAEYVAQRLTELGYSPRTVTFRLPNGKTSRNVIVTAPGASSKRQVILGGHFDTKPPSPGANDNASGCGVMLEIARLLRNQPAAPEVRFVFYGTEEFLTDAPGDNHHLGSRHDARSLTRSQRDNVAAMISVDMVGYGSRFTIRTMQRGPRSLSDALLAQARRDSVPLVFDKDRGRTGWSDHEPYELLGMPSAWLQWQTDPTYHKVGDNAAHMQRRPFAVTGEFLMDFLRGLDDRSLEQFCDR
jgi:Zn-dependent M28 family amino/carboxypeptidase